MRAGPCVVLCALPSQSIHYVVGPTYPVGYYKLLPTGANTQPYNSQLQPTYYLSYLLTLGGINIRLTGGDH